MLEVVSLVKLAIPDEFPVADDMADKWAQGLINNAVLMHRRLLEKIPDAGVFKLLLAEGSNNKWKPMLDASFVSRSGRSANEMTKTHAKNIETAYEQWFNKLALAFETVDGVEAKRFKDQVQNSKDAWISRVETKTLRMTGDKIRGRGASPIAGYWLVGDSKASGLLREEADQVITGGPVDVARPGLKPTLKTALVQKLTQAGVLIANADFDAAVITAQNTLVNDLIKGLQSPTFVDFQPTIDPVKSYCVFVKEEFFRLQIQVVAV
jgi:hypothetical protein